jgi:hypothetical protein
MISREGVRDIDSWPACMQSGYALVSRAQGSVDGDVVTVSCTREGLDNIARPPTFMCELT